MDGKGGIRTFFRKFFKYLIIHWNLFCSHVCIHSITQQNTIIFLIFIIYYFPKNHILLNDKKIDKVFNNQKQINLKSNEFIQNISGFELMKAFIM